MKIKIKSDCRHNFVTEALFEDKGLVNGEYVSRVIINGAEYEWGYKPEGTEDIAKKRFACDQSFVERLGFKILEVVEG